MMNRSDPRYIFAFLLFGSWLGNNIWIPTFSLAETKIKWEKIDSPFKIGEREIQWEILENPKGEGLSDPYYLDDFSNPSESSEKRKDLIHSINQEENDLYKPLRIGISFPTNNQPPIDEAEHLIYSLSTFKSGGSTSGSGNQNYAYMLDYGLNENTHISAFYSVADDPLYSLIDGSKVIPNYWEIYGFSIKKRLFDSTKWSISTLVSLESWLIKNGDDENGNIFNSRESSISNRSFISSISFPISRKLNDNLDLHFLAGGSLLPSKLDAINSEDNFYGNNLYLGSGLSWRVNQKINSFGSILIPMGPGNNVFDSNKYFYRAPIYNFGVDYDISPIIGIQGRITNGFGASPSTSLLTIPSENKLLYFAGISYKPFAIEPPESKLSPRHSVLIFDGLTVGSALIPPRSKSSYSFNIDSKGNLFGSISKSLSNSFQLEIANLGSFNNQNTFSEKDNAFVGTFMSESNFNTRVGGKFLLMSPLRNGFTWLSSRISVGRNQQNKQGYLFNEWINTFELNDKVAINLNPKMVLGGMGSLYSFGLSSNIHLSDLYQLIPELNISMSELSQTNASFSLRRTFKKNFYLDLYVSSAAGIQDLGQLLRSNEIRKGIRMSLLF